MCDSVVKNSSKSIEGELTSKKKEREREGEREAESRRNIRNIIHLHASKLLL